MMIKLLPRKLTLVAAFLLIALTCFVVIAPSNTVDLTFSNSLQAQQTALLTQLFTSITLVSNPAIVIGLALLVSAYFVFQRNYFVATWFTGTVGGADVLATGIKFLIARARPVHQLLPETGFSFPSIHTMSATLFVLLLLTFFKNRHRWLVIAAVIWVSLVALSRIYLGAHYLTDVLAGASLTIVWYQTITFFFLKKPYQ